VGPVQRVYKRREFISYKHLRVQGREWSMSLVNYED
jgi:hypothetical protein